MMNAKRRELLAELMSVVAARCAEIDAAGTSPHETNEVLREFTDSLKRSGALHKVLSPDSLETLAFWFRAGRPTQWLIDYEGDRLRDAIREVELTIFSPDYIQSKAN